MKLNSEIIIYQSPAGNIKIDVRLEDETVWLTQKLMAELFQTTIPNINMHLKSIYEEKELAEEATIKDFLIVQKEGNREINRMQKYYNLDVIISVGYRIKSQVATQFRIWATQVLKDHILKGYSINEKRLQEQNTRLLELQKTVDTNVLMANSTAVRFYIYAANFNLFLEYPLFGAGAAATGAATTGATLGATAGAGAALGVGGATLGATCLGTPYGLSPATAWPPCWRWVLGKSARKRLFQSFPAQIRHC